MDWTTLFQTVLPYLPAQYAGDLVSIRLPHIPRPVSRPNRPPDPKEAGSRLSDRFLALGIPLPRWAAGRKPVKVIGHHAFYRLGLTGNGK